MVPNWYHNDQMWACPPSVKKGKEFGLEWPPR
jgi:hypothetical protein